MLQKKTNHFLIEPHLHCAEKDCQKKKAVEKTQKNFGKTTQLKKKTTALEKKTLKKNKTLLVK